ncbi:MAG: transcriptional repressor [Candidatus Binatia bacterium]|nr:MAG: transcriptional repressor [Candidatus Binatia bacterium]
MRERRTRQLEAVAHALHELDHPTAADVFRAVRRKLPRVSLGTVYRNLEKLVHSEKARVVRVQGEPARYDGNVLPHDHFVCEGCGRLIDLSGEVRPRVRTDRLRREGYVVRGRVLGLFGLCPRCGRESGERNGAA